MTARGGDDGAVIDRLVTAPDGRALQVQEGGDPRGRAVLAHLGTPNSRLLFGPHLLDAARQGIRLISYDRPGYGGSAPLAGRSVSDCAVDVRAIADMLEIERFAVWGVSGGGPHALACAALLPDRVVAAATLASVAPFDAEDLDWFAGTGEENIEEDKLTLSDPAAARAKLEAERRYLLQATTADLASMHPTLVSPVDAAALTDELIAYNTRRYKAGLAPGIEGWWDDNVALLRPWGFALETIPVPVMVWHGRQDRMVPPQHGEWLARRIPHVDAHLSDQDGHLTLGQKRIPEIHAWLLDQF